MEHLTHAEESVMIIIWKSGKIIGIEELFNRAHSYKPEWKRQTVSTFLIHLRKKGYVSMIKQGRHVFYEALVDMKEYRNWLLNEMLEFWYSGDAVSFVLDAINENEDNIEDKNIS